jgi:hypothetical protein
VSKMVVMYLFKFFKLFDFLQTWSMQFISQIVQELYLWNKVRISLLWHLMFTFWTASTVLAILTSRTKSAWDLYPKIYDCRVLDSSIWDTSKIIYLGSFTTELDGLFRIELVIYSTSFWNKNPIYLFEQSNVFFITRLISSSMNFTSVFILTQLENYVEIKSIIKCSYCM